MTLAFVLTLFFLTSSCSRRLMGPFANRVLPLSVGLAGGAVGMYMYLSMPGAIAHHPALKYGQPESSKVRTYSNFVTEVDYGTRNPKWVLEHLDEAQTGSKTASRRSARYYEDEEIDPRFRASLSHYRQSGYDRGHMSPAMNNKNSEKAMSESFVLSNVAPQVGKGFNRDYWYESELRASLTARRSSRCRCIRPHSPSSRFYATPHHLQGSLRAFHQ